MARKITQWPAVDRGSYERWREDFEAVAGQLLESLPHSDAEQIRWILTTLHFVPRQLRAEQVSRAWSSKLSTRINMVDYAVASMVRLLKGNLRETNKVTASLLTAAGIAPSADEGDCGWSAEAVKKRRQRARNHVWASLWGPRFLVSRRSAIMLRLHQWARGWDEQRSIRSAATTKK